jgi:hypothetical protein
MGLGATPGGGWLCISLIFQFVIISQYTQLDRASLKKEKDKHTVSNSNLLEPVSSHLLKMKLDNTIQFGTNTINFANERFFYI